MFSHLDKPEETAITLDASVVAKMLDDLEPMGWKSTFADRVADSGDADIDSLRYLTAANPVADLDQRGGDMQ